jgi:hypothetical protein
MQAGRTSAVFGPLAGLLLAALVAIAPAHAQRRDLEGAVKATFLIRFASFVQWPAESFPDPADPVVICVARDRPFANLVEAAARNERIGARSVVVRQFDAPSASLGCHVLYVAYAPGSGIAETLNLVAGQPVLTVTDERHGSTRGMVHFVLDAGRVRFRIDRDAVEAAGLNPSARLLNVALSVNAGRSR